MTETHVFINPNVKALGCNTIFMNNIESRIANNLLQRRCAISFYLCGLAWDFYWGQPVLPANIINSLIS